MKQILKKLLEYLKKLLCVVLKDILNRFVLWTVAFLFVAFVVLCLFLWFMFGGKA